MVDPAWGPFLFDTSAESWLGRTPDRAAQDWLRAYLRYHKVQISAVTVIERMRGFALLLRWAPEERRGNIERARAAYFAEMGQVWPVDAAVSVIAAEVMALLPHPPSPPRRTHKLAESKQERLVRWRFDTIIAATALAAALPLVHNNPEDFETIRRAIETVPGRFPDLGPLNLIRCGRLA